VSEPINPATAERDKTRAVKRRADINGVEPVYVEGFRGYAHRG
jgi:hypothetical protein